MDRRVFLKRAMRSDSVVVARVSCQNPAQVSLAEDDDVVQAFAANGPNQSFGKAVCQGDQGAMGLSRMPIARRRCLTTEPKTQSRSRIRYPGANPKGKLP